MTNNPAFLFYTGDWFKITQGLNHKLKGMLLELIIYQYNNKGIPNDIEEMSYILNISEEECEKVFKHLAKKLVLTNRTVEPNGKPNDEPNGLTEYYVQPEFQKVFDVNIAKSHKNKILSAYGVLMKKSKLNFRRKELIKKEFDINNFINFNTNEAIKILTEWFTERLTNIDNEKDNDNEEDNKEEEKCYRKFKHLKLSLEDFEKLNRKFTKENIDNVLDAIENHKKNTNYSSLYLTANAWLKKDMNQNKNNESKQETTADRAKRVADAYFDNRGVS